MPNLVRCTLSTLLSATLVVAQSVPSTTVPTPPTKPRLHGFFTRDTTPERTPEGVSTHVPLVTSVAAAATVNGPVLSVDPTANRHAISPGVYGVNVYALHDEAQFRALRMPLTRWGGNATSQYSWSNDTSNHGADWYYELIQESQGKTPAFDAATGNHSAFDRYHELNTRNATKSYATVPIMDWVGGALPNNSCGFSVRKYGAQQATEPYNNRDCGNGQVVTGKKADGTDQTTPLTQLKTTDPRDTDMAVDESYATQWVQHTVARYGTAAQGGVAVWSLDNEPIWWSGNHQNIHPSPAGYDDITARGLRYAAAIKAGDATALVAGPVTGGWWDLFFSLVDLNAGWNTGPDWKYWNNPTDRKAHGDVDFIAYYLQQFANYEKTNGRRILDVLDIHGYIPGTGDNATDATTNAKRLASTKLFWDTSFIPYNDPLFTSSADEYRLGAKWKECECLIPRLKTWVDTYYPGTKIAITEYNLGNLNTTGNALAASALPNYLNGALAQADVLGVFGREGVDYATLWADARPGDPVTFAFQLYRNYDGAGHGFGETSVQATSANQDQLSIYAAQRSDATLTLAIVNKTANDLSTNIALNNFNASGTVERYSYSATDLTAIVRGADLTTTVNGIAATFPANSMTMLVVPATSNATKPVVTGVVNAASRANPITAGALVEVQGTNLGPAAMLRARIVPSAGVIANELAGVKVWFEGYAAPVLAATPNSITALAPNAIAGLTSVHVEVERSGARSNTFAVNVGATAPAIFTTNGSGTGAALALASSVSGLPLLNTATNAAPAGSKLTLFVTGLGAMDPPSADGRMGTPASGASTVNAVTVSVGGKTAAGVTAAPAGGTLAGVAAVTFTVPSGAGTGAVAVTVSAGGVSSPGGITLYLR